MATTGEIVLGAVYANALLGATAAVLTVGGADYPITAIDLTEGVTVLEGVQTADPRAAIRAVDLAALGLAAAQLDDQVVTLGGVAWRISSVLPKPSPAGEADGEYLLFLQGAP